MPQANLLESNTSTLYLTQAYMNCNFQTEKIVAFRRDTDVAIPTGEKAYTNFNMIQCRKLLQRVGMYKSNGDIKALIGFPHI